MNRRVDVTLTKTLLRYVDDLVDAGLHGFTRADVVRRMVSEGIERRIESRLLPRPGLVADLKPHDRAGDVYGIDSEA